MTKKVIFLPWVKFKVFFEKVLVTQKFLYILLRVILDKTLRTSKKKFGIEHLISSIFIKFNIDKALEESHVI